MTLLTLCALIQVQNSSAQITTVFSDDFSANTSATYTTTGAIGASAWSVSRLGADWGARRNTSPAQLELTNDVGATANVTGYCYAYTPVFNSTLASQGGVITWTFNMRTNRTNLSGFSATTNYGMAMVIASTSNTPNISGSGYAVVIGAGATNNLSLISFNNGLQGTLTTIVAPGGTPAAQTNYLSVRVTYTPGTNSWTLASRDDGSTAFADPTTGTLTNIGSAAVNSTYTGTTMTSIGGYWQGSTGATQTAFIDNVKVTVNTTPTLTATALTAFGNACINSTTGANSFTITGTNLTATDVTIGPLAGYSFSNTAGGTYLTTLPVTQPGGSFSQQVFVKFSPTAAQSYAGNIPVSGGGATAITVAASGTGQNLFGGTFTVGTGGDYATLALAVADYNSKCLNGPVVFNLTDATYTTETFPITINANAGASATNTLTIKTTQAATTISGSSSSALIVLNAADYVTIDGSVSSTANTICPLSTASRNLTLTNTSSSSSSAVVWLQSASTDGATNNTIKNINLTGNSNTTTLFGLGSGSSTISLSSLGNGNNSNSFINNSISKTQHGIFSQGLSVAAKNTGTLISQNLLNTASPNNIQRSGITVGYENGIIISGNSISNLAAGSSSYAWGISVGNLVTITTTAPTGGNEVINATINNNIIGTVRAASTFGAGGILVAAATSGTNSIVNNVISDVAANGTAGDCAIGILAAGGAGSTTQIYHNSVSLTATLTGGSTPNIALALGGSSPTMDVRNNILSSTGSTGTGANRAIALSYTGTTGNYTNLTSNNNNFFVSGGGGTAGIAITGGWSAGTVRATRAAWTTETGRDANSVETNPLFTSSSSLVLQLGSGAIGTGATGLPVTTDVTCATRTTPPSMGAYDGATDNLAPSITYTGLTNTCTPGVRTLTASITDPSGVPQSGAGLPVAYYKVQGGTYTAVTGVYTTGNTYTFEIGGTVLPGDTVSYYIVAQDGLATPNVGAFPSAGAAGFTANPPAATTPPSSPSVYLLHRILNGTYTVGATGTFKTLTQAVANYNNGCAMTGAVVFSLIDASYTTETFPITINSNAGASATNTLTIKPTLANTTISGSASSALIIINGADYVTIDGSIGSVVNSVCPLAAASRDLTLTNTNSSTSSTVIWLQTATADGATNNTIRNLNLIGNSNTTTLFGVGSGSSTISTGSLGASNNNNSFINNNISKTQYGIFSQGASTANKNTGNVISQNLVNTASPNHIGKGGILAGFEDGITITGNNISGILSTTTADAFGISLGVVSFINTTITSNEVINALVNKNLISGVVNNATGSAVGIFVGAAGSGTNAIRNNMISGISANGVTTDFAAGIAIGGGAGATNIYHNSVSMSGTILGSTAGSTQSCALAVTTAVAPTLDIRNNILSNTQISNTSGTTKFYAIGFGYASTVGNYTGLTSNNNDLYVSAGAAYFTGITGGLGAGTTRLTLASWTTETGRDGASVAIAPVFVSASDLHLINFSNNSLNAAAAAGLAADDIDCELRDASTPDIGADEFIPPVGTDVGVTGLVAPSLVTGCYSNSETVTVSVKNYSSLAIDFSINPVTVNVTAGSYAGSFVLSSGTLAGGVSQDVTMSTTIDMSAPGVYIFNATTVLTGDGNPANDAMTAVVRTNTSYSGTYHIGAGKDYTTITAAVAAYNSAGCLTGPVTFILDDAAYTGETFPITINSHATASSTNTLTIKPSVAGTTISGSSTSAIFVLNGADYVTIDGSISSTANTICPFSTASRDLTITNTSTSTSSAVIWLQTTAGNAATNNTIKNLNLIGNSNTQTLFGVGSGSTTISTSSLGTGNINNSFINNSISKTQYGIFSQGASTANRNTGTVVNQNLLNTASPNNIGKGGILIGFDNGAVVSGNNIAGISVSGDAFGISLGMTSWVATTSSGNEVINATVNKNIISGVTGSGTSSAAGIVVAPATSGINTISNNMIAGVTSNATGGDFTAGIFILGGTGSTSRVYFNTVSMTGDRGAATTGNSHALAVNGSTPIVDIKNNILNNTQTTSGSGKSYAIGLGYSSTTGNYVNLTSNNNDLFVSGANGVLAATGTLNTSTDRTTLTAWTTETGADAASKNIAPVFTSSTDLHLIVTLNNTLNAAGTPLSITDDIDCTTRDASTPDIGADEFTPPVGNDVGITALVAPAASGCYTTTEAVTVTLRNYSTTTLDFSTDNVTVTVTTGAYAGTATITTGTLESGETMNVTVTPTIDLSIPGAYTFNATASITGDINAGNDAITPVIRNNTSLSGTFQVGASQPAPFSTLTSAINAYNTASCLTGPVTFVLTDASYTTAETFPISINVHPNASAVNTLTIKPLSAATIAGSVASNSLIKLNGADYITIDGSNSGGIDRSLTVTNTSTTAPTAISIVSAGTGAGATNNTIKNINLSTGISTSAAYGVAVGGNTPGSSGADNDNTSIQNNSISGTTTGIYANGTASVTAGGLDNLLISANTIATNTTIASTGIQAGNALNSIISLNSISVETSFAGSPVGVSAETGFISSEISRNTITKVLTTNTGGWGGRGITIGTGTATSNLTVSNNIVYGVNGSNFSGFGNSSAMGIAIGIIGGSSTITTTTGGVNLYYNSVFLSGTYSNSTSAITAALYVGSGASALDTRNNIFANSLINTGTGTSSKSYGVYSAVAKTAYTNLNYNDYYTAGGGAVSGFLNFLSSDVTTLANWKTATSQDVNSVSVDPQFVSATNLHLQNASALNAAGNPVAGITTDYDGDLRNATTPDIGADEFTPPCIAPAVQPTALVLVPQANGTSINVAFTASIPAPNSYLVVRTTTNTQPVPADLTMYTVGADAIGYIESIGTSVSFVSTGLTQGTQYYYWIFAYNHTICSGGPLYNSVEPLNGNATTLSPCITPSAQPTVLVFSNVNGTNLTGSFTGTTPAADYLVVRTTSNTEPAPGPADGTTYTAGAAALGGIIESAGAALTFNSIGLTQGVTYYYYIYSYNTTACTGGPVYLSASPLTGSATTLACPVPGTYSVGPTGTYKSITQVVDVLGGCTLTGAYVFELQAAYASSVETFPIGIPSFAGSTATNTVTFRPEAGASALNITSVNTTGTLLLNAAQYVTFDGRAGGSGTAKELTIENTNVGTSYAMRFVNDASNNTIQYCNVRSANSGTSSGTIVFGTTTGTTGNDNNSIISNDIYDAATGTPANGILSVGSVSPADNSSNIISDNNIYNFFSATGDMNGVFVSTNNSSWTISGNSFYQTTTRNLTGSSNAFTAIQSAASSIGIIITNNIIGGQAANAAGSALTITGSGLLTTMRISGSAAAVASVQGNTIKNISFTSSSTSTTQSLVSLVSGKINFGTITGNTLGSQTANGSVSISLSAGTIFSGIVSGTGATDVVNISNNTIGGIDVSGTGLISVRGIGFQGTSGTYTISGNTIGSVTTSNSISNASNSSLLGIFGTASLASAVQTISGNTIANLSSIGTGTGSITRGIITQGSTGGAYNSIGNTIYNLSSASTTTNITTTPSVAGISHSAATTAGQSIVNNTIYNLTNTTSGSTTVGVTGIVYSGPTAGTNIVSRNRIYSLSLASTSAASSIQGIYAAAGTSTYQNNMIRLGVNSTATGYVINGINDAAGTNNYYFNSVYIGGMDVATSTSRTIAFVSAVTTNTRIFQNNIFFNGRSNAAGTAKHYAVSLAGTAANPAGLTSNNNIYYTSGTGGVLGLFNTADVTTIAAWRTATGQDAVSFNADPMFIDPAAITPDLHINTTVPSVAESNGTLIASVTDDIDGDVRASLTPTDIGADAFNGIQATPVINSVTVTPGGQCTVVSHTVTATVTVTANPITGVSLNYSFNGAASVSIPMTLTTGSATSGTSTWTGEIPAASTYNVPVNWSVTATDGSFTTVAAGAGYADDIYGGVTATVTATPNAYCAGGSSVLSISLANNSTRVYCTPALTSMVTGDYLNNFTFANITNNGSGDAANDYTYYSALTANVVANGTTSYSISLTPGGTFSQQFRIWIDYNQNGIFETTESVFNTTSSVSSPSSATGSITIPHTALNGVTRMRVFCRFSSTPGTSEACNSSQQYGEYEDYNVSITGGTDPLAASAYSWSDGTTVVATTNAATVVPVTTTTYTPTLTFSNGCTKTFTGTVVTVTPLPAQPIAANSTQCGTGIPVAFVITGFASGSTGDFRWYDAPTGGNLIQTGGTTYQGSVSATTVFYVSESDGICMSARSALTVTVNPPDAVQAEVDNNNPCVNSSVMLTATNVAPSPVQNYTYTWTASPAAGSGIPTSITGNSISVTPTVNGTYVYTVTATEGDCNTTSTIAITTKALPLISAATATPSTICNGETAVLNATTPTLTNVSGTIGTGVLTNAVTSTGSSGYPAPFGNHYQGAMNQMLITAAELNAAGLQAGNITSISFDVATPNTSPLSGFNIGIKSTSLSALPSTMQTGFTTVFGPVTYTPSATAGYAANTIVFSTPFVWNGISNIIIQTCFANTGFTQNAVFRQTATSYQSTIVFRADATTVCSATGSATFTYNQRPNMRFTGQAIVNDAGSLTWEWNPGAIPGNNVSVSPSTSTVYTVTATDNATTCSNTSTVNVTVNPIPNTPTATSSEQCGTQFPLASVSSTNGTGPHTFKWYAVPTGGTAVQTGSSTTYLSNISITTTLYVSEISAEGCESARVPVQIDVIAADAIAPSVEAGSHCAGSGITLHANHVVESNDYIFTWTASPEAGSGISGSATGADITIVPTIAGTYVYTVTAYDADKGCTNIQTISVIVNAPPAITSVTATPATICTGGSATLSAQSVNAAAGTATIGAGVSSTSSYNGLYFTSWSNKHLQIMIRASELSSFGLQAGNITTVSFPTTSGTASVKDFTVKMAHTAATDMSALLNTGFSQVYFAASHPQVANTNNTITLNTPFNWNGTSNIVIDICFGDAGSASTISSTAPSDATSYVSVARVFGAAATAASAICSDLSSGLFTYSVRPKILLGGQVGSNITNTLTWVWNPGALTGSTVSVTPGVTTSYTATTTNANGCTTTSAPITVTVPVIAAPVATNSTQCGIHIPTASVAGAGGTYKWYSAASGGALLQSSTSSTFTSPVSVTTTFYVSESDGLCEGPRTPVTVTVNQPDAVTAVASSLSICPNGNLQLSANQSGTTNSYTYTWSAFPVAGSGIAAPMSGNTVNINPPAAGTYVYTVLAEDISVSCITSSSITVTVNSNPVIDTIVATPQIVCPGSNTLITAISGRLGRDNAATKITTNGSPYRMGTTVGNQIRNQYLITASELIAANITAGNLTSVAFTVNSGGGGSLSNLTFRMSATAATSLTTTFLTPTFTTVLTVPAYTPVAGVNTHNFTSPFVWDGTSNIVLEVCGTLATAGTNAVLATTVTSVNTTTGNAATTGCTNTTGTSVALARPTLAFGTNLNWVWNGGQTGNVLNVTNVTSTTTYTVTATNPVTGCSSMSAVTVTVNPVSALATATATSICAGGSSVLDVSTTAVSPTYSWNNGSAVVSTNKTFTVTPATTTTYTVTVTDACAFTATSSVTITVNALPSASIAEAGPFTLCEPATQTLTAITNATSPVYQWYLNGTAITGATGSTYVVSTIGTGSYTVRVTESATGCNSAVSSGTSVTINPQPSAIIITPASPSPVCSGVSQTLTASISPQPLTTTATTGTISVSIPDNNTTGIVSNLAVSGVPVGATIDSIIVTFNINHSFAEDVLVNLEAPNGQRLNLVAGVYITSGTSFSNTRITSDLTKPFMPESGPFTGTYKPDADLTGFDIAATPAPTTDNFSNLFSTPNGTWRLRVYDDDVGATGTLTNWNIKISYKGLPAIVWSPATGLNTTTGATVIATPATTTTYTATVTNAQGCSNAGSVTVDIIPLPATSFTGLASAYCINSAPATLTGSPSGGTFSGPGISGNSFDPAAAGTGTHTITYTYSDGTCSNNATQSVTVNALPVVSISGLAATHCTTAGSVTLTGSPAGGTFSGPGVTGNIFNPASAGPGLHVISYFYSDPVTGCSATATQNVTVESCTNTITLNLKVLVQGYCQNVGTANPMDNFGSGGCLYVNGLSTNPLDADNITISLMNADDGTLLETQTGMLHTDGTVSVTFANAVSGDSYYIRVNHRNSIETWSAVPVEVGPVTTYDFTTSASQAYGDNMVQVSPGVWAMYSGDITDGTTVGTQDGAIESADYVQMETDVLSILFGYYHSDLTGDGIVESADYVLMETNVSRIIFVARPF